MPRTPLLNSLAGLAAGISPGPGVSRRSFIASAGIAALAKKSFAQAPRVIVIGAGLAGLTAAFRLKKKGVDSTIYEAASRAGGRCWSLRGAFDDGQIVERGGELIDTSHHAIRQLCQELRLKLDNLLQTESRGSEPFYFIDAAPYTYDEATRDMKECWQKLHRDVSEASYPTTYYQSTVRGRELDLMTIVDWINESVPGGISSRLGQLLDITYNIEYGTESSQQSALNLIYLLGYRGQGRLRIFGPSNEKYHVNGGNDQIVACLVDALPNQVRYGCYLDAVRTNADGTVTVRLRTATGVFEDTADKLVVAIPFSILRSSVDLTQAGWRDLKRTAINELGMGANSKFHLQFHNRLWNNLGNNGETYSDTGYQITWEVTRGQSGASGILVNYTGGDTALAANTKTAAQVLAEVEPVLPAISLQFNGKTQLEYWPGNPLTLGSYSFWKPGQYQKFAGIEGEPEGNAHFCGEHTSLDFQGYLNGAVDSGERAAAEILASLK